MLWRVSTTNKPKANLWAHGCSTTSLSIPHCCQTERWSCGRQLHNEVCISKRFALWKRIANSHRIDHESHRGGRKQTPMLRRWSVIHWGISILFNSFLPRQVERWRHILYIHFGEAIKPSILPYIPPSVCFITQLMDQCIGKYLNK